ncbi:GDP-L-fucose synthase [Candidatus Burarchaeum australiense]|nr:GDP-L-fucose synthase [Candidatus Burarchaeum australiense]
MRLLVIGASGQLGRALVEEAPEWDFEAMGTYESRPAASASPPLQHFHLDMTDAKEVESVFEKAKPDACVLAAAYTNVDGCETDKAMADRINVEGTRNVAEACKRRNCLFVFISSDYVFDGKKGPYSEEDEPNPINHYGRTKLEGEKIALGVKEHLVVRTTIVFDFREAKNFATRLAERLRAGEQVLVPVDQVGSPTWAPNLAEAICELISEKKRGTYHVVGRDLMNRFEFALTVARFFALDERLLKPVKTADLAQAARRPLKAGMKINKAKKELQTKLLGVKEALDEAEERGMLGKFAEQC